MKTAGEGAIILVCINSNAVSVADVDDIFSLVTKGRVRNFAY